MNKVALDASTLLALISNEKGASRVETLIGNIVMSSVGIIGVASKICDILGYDSENHLLTQL